MDDEIKNHSAKNVLTRIPESADLKADHVINVLDFEISRIISQEKEHGWTAWAIYGSIATMLWLLLNQIDTSSFAWSNVAAIFLVLSVVLDLITDISDLLSTSVRDDKRTSRYYLGNIMAAARLFLICSAARSVVLIILLNQIGHFVPVLYRVMGDIYYGLSLVGTSLAIALSYSTLPILSSPMKGQIRKAGLTLKILSVVILFLLATSLLAYFMSTFQLTISDLKIGGILTALTYVLFLLIQRESSSPLLSSLVNIRRSLAFGHIALQDAVRQADIALSGLRINDLLQAEVKEILEMHDRISTVQENLNKKVEAVQLMWPTKFCKLSKDEQLVIKKDVETWSSEFKEIGELAKKNLARVGRLTAKITWITGLSTNYPPEIADMVAQINMATKVSKEKLERFGSIHQSLKEAMEKPCFESCSKVKEIE